MKREYIVAYEEAYADGVYFAHPIGELGQELVRCKECRWRKQDKSCDLNCRIDYIDGTETDMWFYTEDDDFCSYGERRIT